ncbi:SET domain-containing protein-lysine N-methyltransferase [Legionella maioricensis]|uniref:SET domain-containing protein-lysine N-methyltransferase n=1 Tax=Legionella maioricensis TaxID=2896528 RepID=A0A9X2D1V5_9GAMM|nr:SET domain-containing protein-lysine N-methyltransferase [Legionella maioricensis]MCL9684555.1 SET domain-containing protein-lysine N-methyltransferase [Legionella maioricensis]MCL9687851.1 SET domain-containing protein-lysine N-methyltransferase [Legionella maioricensis]
MVNITLSNKNPCSPHSQVAIDIDAGLARFADNREISLKQLINDSDFIHPLINEPCIPIPHHLLHYEYENVEGLLYSGIYVYSRLIKAEKPLDCIFKINPSPLFQISPQVNDLHFSINRCKAAKETISIGQLEAITSHLLGFKFVFSEAIIINDQFTIKDLPSSVDGDALYISDEKLIALLKTPRDFSRYEIRYIHPEIGLGVYSREHIKKGEIISFYTGIKNHDLPRSPFSFIPKADCLMMRLDACQHGNITRFINHAPQRHTSSKSSFLEANIKSNSHYLNGIEVIVYTATKDILKGEQLLVDYGDAYFRDDEMFLFKTDGGVINPHRTFIGSNTSNKIRHLKIMAIHGVKKAQIYLLVRIVIIISLIAALQISATFIQ